jgi:phospholipase/lecithinase/hemolysin
MPFQRLRRAVLAAACVSSVLLAACGGGNDVVSQFQPTRMVAFGDAFSDAGQRGVQYTVNDGNANNWTQRLASRYGLSLKSVSAGGLSYAVGSARINTHPDAGGNAATPTVAEQITTFLASQAPSSDDLVVVSGGIGDIISEVAALNAGGSSAQATANVEQAGRDLGAQVRRLVDAGAKHVVVVGPYNLGRTPWAATTGQQSLLQDLVTRFNDRLLVSIVDLGSKVLFVDATYYFNLVTGSPSAYSFTDISSVVCTATDAGAGIGIGLGQVNASLCTSGTLAPGLAAATTLFADPVYVTPMAHERFGDFAYDRLKARF